MPVEDTPQVERRSGGERRRRTLRAYSPGWQTLRRKGGRRASDRVYASVDLYSPRIALVALGIMLLCCCDAFITIELMARGASEANPIMAFFMRAGMGWFSAIKLLLTAIGVVVLVACSSMRVFRRIPGERLLHALLGCYVVLVVYEIAITL